MLAKNIRGILLTALVAACAPFAAGCVVEAEAPVYDAEYQPEVTQNGYIVYYDNYGAPYYYYGGRTVYVDRSDPYYNRYVYHYRTYGPRYQRWYTRHGYRYRSYRYRR
jgi:hypothetical protein